MTIYIRHPFVWFVAICVVIVAAFAGVAHANPATFSIKSTATATTSPAYMTAGTATTTLTYDSTLNGNGDFTAANGISLLVQFIGSSSPLSTLNIDVQYSQDAIDWYSIAGGTDVDNGIGSSTPSLSNPTVFTLAFASTTVDKGAGITATTTRIANLDMPTRYVRAIFTLPVGSQPGAVWAQFVAQKQNR